MDLVIYSKPGCCLCEGLLEKLAQVEEPKFNLEVRDITTNLNWFEKYQYEIPVLCLIQNQVEQELPRISPRSPIRKLQELLQKYVLL